tara:strand:- start:331 stop:567 length:237 start_codon:yes stop_codon:yes gene_type:complete
MSEELMEYKVLNAEIVRETFKELGGKTGFFHNPMDPDSWESVLNAHAQEGWKVISSNGYVYPGENGSSDLIVILGRTI